VIASHAVTIVVPGIATPLEPIEAEVTLDENWAPFVQARAVLPLVDSDQIEALDPRPLRRATVRVRQQFGADATLAAITGRYAGRGGLGGISEDYQGEQLSDFAATLYDHWTVPGAARQADYVRTFDLGLRTRRVDHAAGTITIELASDEAQLQDNAHLHFEPYFVPVNNLRAAVEHALSRIGAVLGAADLEAHLVPFDAGKNPINPGADAWEWISPLVQQAGRRLWCDGNRLWHLEYALPTLNPIVPLTGADTIVSGTDTISRDRDYYTAVLVTYRWTQLDGVAKTAYEIARMSAASVPANQRVFKVDYNRPWTAPGAATRVLQSILGRGRGLEVSAVNDYRVEPGRAVNITLPSTPVQFGYAAAVTWGWPADEMRVRMRYAIDAGAIETEYTPVPDPEEEP
jgi:hypothetical protein